MLTAPCARAITTGAAHLMPAALAALFVRGTPLVLSRNRNVSTHAGTRVHLPQACTAAATNWAATAAAAPSGLLALVHSAPRQQPVLVPCGPAYGSLVIGLAEEMAMESGAVIDRSEVQAARRMFRTGGQVESSKLTALHSRDALEDLAARLALAHSKAAGAQ